MSRKTLLAGAAALMMVPVAAEARTVAFDFETENGVFAVSGELALSDTLNSLGGYDVTGISGTVAGPKGGTIDGLAKGKNLGSYDDTLFTADPVFDGAGLLFDAGPYKYKISSVFNGAGWIYELSSNNPKGGFPAAGTLVAGVPEPSTWVMLGLGFAGLSMVGRRTPRPERFCPAFG
jgi:PEP-CTERM motif